MFFELLLCVFWTLFWVFFTLLCVFELYCVFLNLIVWNCFFLCVKTLISTNCYYLPLTVRFRRQCQKRQGAAVRSMTYSTGWTTWRWDTRARSRTRSTTGRSTYSASGSPSSWSAGFWATWSSTRAVSGAATTPSGM